jgi:hypothetical protein
MKRNFLFMSGLVFFALPQLLFAQPNSASVRLNINISQVQSLTVNESQGQLDFNFSKKEDFKNGVNINERNHLNVFSSGRFVVKVSTQGNFTGVDNRFIPASSVSITPYATGGMTHVPGMITGNNVSLSPREAKTIIKSPTHGTTATSFDVLYTASGTGYAMLDNGTYSGTVVYTIEVE